MVPTNVLNGRVIVAGKLRAPSCAISAKRFTMAIVRTNPNAVSRCPRCSYSLFVRAFLRVCRKPRIQRPCARPHYEEEYRSQQHREVRACFMRHAPETVRREFAETKAPKTIAQKNRKL